MNALANHSGCRNRKQARVPDFLFPCRDLEVLYISLLGKFIYLIGMPSAKHKDGRASFARTKHPNRCAWNPELATDDVLRMVGIRRLWDRAAPAFKRVAHLGWQIRKCTRLEPP